MSNSPMQFHNDEIIYYNDVRVRVRNFFPILFVIYSENAWAAFDSCKTDEMNEW